MSKYNPDHARYILEVFAECEYSSAWSLMELQLQISEEEAITHCGWLLDWGYVEGEPETICNRLAPLDYNELRLTGQGVLFLETFRDPNFYSQVKQKATEIGCGLIPNMLMMIAQRFVASGG